MHTDIRPFVIQVESTTLSIPLEEAEARQLAVGLNNVLKTFQEKQTAERPKRWDSMSVTLEGGSSDSRQSLQAMCNPNAHATAFEARVWLSVKTGGMSVATEAKLSAFRAALEAYFEQLRTSKTVA
ncbi:hypothetical protein ACKKBG_A12325 [Auxenochlorella protothecoides x Auxenochlorella symbiontica]